MSTHDVHHLPTADRLEPLDAAQFALAWERKRRLEAELAHANSEVQHIATALREKYELQDGEAFNVNGHIQRVEAPTDPPAPPAGDNGAGPTDPPRAS